MTVLGRGSKVIGGTIKTELTRELLNTSLLDGFLPRCAATDLPLRRAAGRPDRDRPALRRRSGDHAHLARFLGQQAGSLHTGGAMIRPSAVLFNGGVFKATELRQARSTSLPTGRAIPCPSCNRPTWISPWPGAPRIRQVRRGRGVRIRGGVARSYYVGLGTPVPAVPGVPPPIKALCVVPMGMEEGTEADVPSSELGLIVGEPAVFRFLSSTTRRDDPVGTVLDRWNPEEIQELAPLETALAAEEGVQGEIVPVRLHSNVNEVGTLELLVPEHPRPPPLEARIQRPRTLRGLIGERNHRKDPGEAPGRSIAGASGSDSTLPRDRASVLLRDFSLNGSHLRDGFFDHLPESFPTLWLDGKSIGQGLDIWHRETQ